MIINNENKNVKQFTQVKEHFNDTLKQFNLTQKSMETMDDFCGYLWNRKTFQNIPLLLQHILFYCQSDLIGFDFCKCLADILFREKLILTSDVVQLNDISDQEFVFQKNAIYYVFLSSPEDIARVHKLLSEYWGNCNKKYVQDKIVVVGLEANSALHEILYNADEGHHLFFRLLHHHVTSLMEEREHIFYLLWKRLQASQYKFNQEFADTLRDYVLTIYPKREIEDTGAFMSDIERRVYSLYFGKHIAGEAAGAECVPKYRKAEIAMDPEVNQEPHQNYQMASICNDESLMYQENSGKEIKNILLLTLSTLSVRDGEVKQNSYIYRENEQEYKVKGYGQLEPVPKMLARKLSYEDQKLDLIIILASKDTQKNINFFETVPQEDEAEQIRYRFENANALDFFIHQIHNDAFCGNTQFLVIDSEEYKDVIRKTADQLRSIHNKNSEMHLYVDMHGGPRANQLLVDAILSLLKMDGISVKDAFNIARGGKDVPIDNALESVRMFDFVSGMNEFISYGFGKGIQRYVNQLGNSDEDYRTFAECIKKISDALLLCDVMEFEAALDNLNKVIEKLKNKGGNENYIGMFIENIENDYGELLDKNQRTLIKEIEWAQKKGFYQQCLAIIESKTPEYVFSKFINYQDESIRIKLVESNNSPQNISKTLQDFYRCEGSNNESEQSRISYGLLYCTGKARSCWIENGRAVIKVVYSSKNKSKKYEIEYFTNITEINMLEEFVDRWKVLKGIRNEVMHIRDNKKGVEERTVENVNKLIDEYRYYFDKLDKDSVYASADTEDKKSADLEHKSIKPDEIYEVRISGFSKKKGNTWVKFLKTEDASPYDNVIKSNLPGDGFLSGQDYGNIGDILRVKVAEDDPQIRFEITGE